ncbi:hypothetical protein HK099_003355 [Clydaea vesicula]|uniref:F-box domain-containing protein n=1 Tax=Clydaea vesicula TaxID=447962 RepID=A0AAD5XYW7_9FUNG|nr:hypothetical protein HK099_003355 [Clydaea vesicula]
MHYINNLVKALAVCLIEAHKHNPTGSSGDKTGHLVAFFTASQKLMDVKSKRALGDASSFGLKISEIWNCNDIGVKDKTKIHDSNKKNFEKEVSSSKNKSIILPQELLEKIFNLLTQNDLFNISLTSKKFNNFVIPLLYKKPTITSPKNFCIFLNTIFTDDYNNANSSLWKYEYFVETIYFSPTNVGSFESIVATDSCISLDLNQVHSVLFRFLNFDRGIESYGGHPIFLMLLTTAKITFPTLLSIREKNKDFFEGPAIKTSEGSWY